MVRSLWPRNCGLSASTTSSRPICSRSISCMYLRSALRHFRDYCYNYEVVFWNVFRAFFFRCYISFNRRWHSSYGDTIRASWPYLRQRPFSIFDATFLRLLMCSSLTSSIIFEENEYRKRDVLIGLMIYWGEEWVCKASYIIMMFVKNTSTLSFSSTPFAISWWYTTLPKKLLV